MNKKIETKEARLFWFSSTVTGAGNGLSLRLHARTKQHRTQLDCPDCRQSSNGNYHYDKGSMANDL